MTDLQTKYTIKADLERNLLRYSIAGFWDEETMKAFLIELGRAAKPFIQSGQRFSAIGNMSDFVPQKRETADAIQDSLMLAKKNGLVRLALVAATPLVIIQYRRLTQGLEFEAFDDPISAENWILRQQAV